MTKDDALEFYQVLSKVIELNAELMQYIFKLLNREE